MKISWTTWHNDSLPTCCVGYWTLKRILLVSVRAAHSEKMCIGVSSEPSSQQSLHSWLPLRLAVVRCFFHHPWPERNWILLPRFSLDMFINFVAKIGPSLMNQNLFCLWPPRRDHSLRLYKCEIGNFQLPEVRVIFKDRPTYI